MDDDLGTFLFWLAVLAAIIVYANWDSDNWFGRYRIAFSHDVEYRDVIMANKPHDCDFLTAPLGSKHCTYESVVTAAKRDGRRGVVVTWVKVRD